MRSRTLLLFHSAVHLDYFISLLLHNRCPKRKWFNIMSLVSDRSTRWGLELSSDGLFFMGLLSAVWLYFVF